MYEFYSSSIYRRWVGPILLPITLILMSQKLWVKHSEQVLTRQGLGVWKITKETHSLFPGKHYQCHPAILPGSVLKFCVRWLLMGSDVLRTKLTNILTKLIYILPSLLSELWAICFSEYYEIVKLYLNAINLKAS